MTVWMADGGRQSDVSVLDLIPDSYEKTGIEFTSFVSNVRHRFLCEGIKVFGTEMGRGER
jgi:hypothetical protein